MRAETSFSSLGLATFLVCALTGCPHERGAAPISGETPANSASSSVPTSGAEDPLGDAGPATSTPAASSSTEAQEPPMPAKSPIAAPADVAAPSEGSTRTASGLASKVVTPGKGGPHPSAADRVRVHYTGWTKDGEMFDSSVARGESIVFPLNGVIAGWTEGVQLMTVGEKRRLWIPAALAYGEKPRGGAPGGDLTFDVELLEVMAAPKAPTVPEDVAAAPATATKTKSGLAYRVLRPGKAGGAKPKATDTVSVHYSGWTTDGKMFDSSVARGEPAEFPLNRVIAGWTEGVQLMTVGELTRFWIPGALAYGDKPRGGAPGGTLVFDVELLSIE